MYRVDERCGRVATGRVDDFSTKAAQWAFRLLASRPLAAMFLSDGHASVSFPITFLLL